VRSLRLLALVAIVASYAAAPVVGRWVTTANASTVSGASSPDAVYSPANQNDNQDELCTSDNPRKQKKCHYNMTNADNDNDDGFVNDGSGGGDRQPGGTITVSTADPTRGQDMSFTVYASGNDLDQIWWWVTNYNPNGNDNDDFLMNGEPHYSGCDGNNTCQQTVNLNAGNPGTFLIHAKARDHQGRESVELAAEIRVH
jgi:hypothetical protein